MNEASTVRVYDPSTPLTTIPISTMEAALKNPQIIRIPSSSWIASKAGLISTFGVALVLVSGCIAYWSQLVRFLPEPLRRPASYTWNKASDVPLANVVLQVPGLKDCARSQVPAEWYASNVNAELDCVASRVMDDETGMYLVPLARAAELSLFHQFTYSLRLLEPNCILHCRQNVVNVDRVGVAFSLSDQIIFVEP